MQLLIDIGLSILYFCLFLLVCAWTWRFWVMYVQQKAMNKLDWVMLEFKLPREIMKSPMATEVAIATLLQGGGIGDSYSRVFKGNLPAYSSLEIASLEGVIHFYIRTQKKFRQLVESNFYAQYPGIEIVVADDYTSAIRYHHLTKDVSMWGVSYKTSKTWKPVNPKTGEEYKDEKGEAYSMRADFLPIKTYVDYGLDKDPKEEFKIDPITPLLEVMGSMGKGEYMWYQLLVQDESVYDGKKKMPKFYVNEVSHEHLSLSDMAATFKKQMRIASWNKKGTKVVDQFNVPTMIESFIKKSDDEYEQEFTETEKDGKTIKIPKKKIAEYLETKPVPKKEMDLTFEEKEELESVNKKFSKPLALCIMRLIYVTKNENFNPAHIQNVLSYPKPFKGVNSIGPAFFSDPYAYPWQNWGKRRTAWRTEELFEAFVEREGFSPHVKGREELDKFEDRVFWSSNIRQRKLFRMIFESIFYPFDHPHADDAFTLNTEEIATLWHLPGAVASTPTLPRIDSNKGVAPVNLPL